MLRSIFPPTTEQRCWLGHGTVAKTEWRLLFSKKWVFKGETERRDTQRTTTRTKYVILVSLLKGPDVSEGDMLGSDGGYHDETYLTQDGIVC